MRKYGWIALLTAACDQAAKYAARSLGARAVTLIPGILGLRYAENTGIAFSLLSGRPWLLGVLSLVLTGAGAAALSRYELGALPSVAAMLLLGGAVGNMIDRFITGYVVDMLEVLAFRFAICNVADVALTAGCALMAVSLLFRPDDWRRKKHGNTRGDAA